MNLNHYSENIHESSGMEMPSFFNGVSSITLFPDDFVFSKDSNETDRKALLNDWQMIGNDLKKAMEIYKQEGKSGTKQK